MWEPGIIDILAEEFGISIPEEFLLAVERKENAERRERRRNFKRKQRESASEQMKILPDATFQRMFRLSRKLFYDVLLPKSRN